MCTFAATYVSVVESGATPGSCRYPASKEEFSGTLPGPYCPRTMSVPIFASVYGRIDCKTLIFSLRTAVASNTAGGSIATSEVNCRTWL